VDANRSPLQVHKDVKALVAALFGKRVRVEIAGESSPRLTPEPEVSGLGSVANGGT
jgi:hypothetical protein